MANPNKIRSQDVDWSAGTSWASTKFLKGDGTWDTSPITTITNTVFVSKGGNDSTGLAERLDKPFLTLAAARTAAVALTPSATKRILIVVFPGTYTEQLVLANYVDWDLTNSVIDLQAGAGVSTINDNNVACDSIIYGKSQILRTTAGSGSAIVTQNSSTILKVFAAYISSFSSVTITCSGATQYIEAYKIENTGSTGALSVTSGNQIVKGNINTVSSNAITISGAGTQYLYGNITVSSSGNCANCTTGTQYVYGNLSSAGSGITCTTGTQYVYGNISATTFGCNITQTSGRQYVTGNISSSTNHTVICSNGIQNIVGNCSHTGVAASDFNGAFCNGGGSQNIIGNISSTDTGTLSYGVYHSSSGSSTYQGTITSATVEGVYVTTGTAKFKSGSKIITTGTNMGAVLQTSGSLILDNCTLIATGTGNSITDGSTVLIYGTSVGNKPLGTAITQVGSLIIDSAVV